MTEMVNTPINKQNHLASSNNSYQPSVPISVYRQLAKELEATKNQLQSYQLENQQLSRKNQQLQAELTKFVNLTRNIQNLVNSHNLHSTINNHENLAHQPSHSHQVREIKHSQPHTILESEKVNSVNGWLLGILMIIIVLTAFSASFLIFLPKSNNHNTNVK